MANKPLSLLTMMPESLRVAVVSDIHGNLPALEAVLADIERRGPFERRIANGDYCLNGPDPAAALDVVTSWATDMTVGNTDRDIVNLGADDPDLGEKKLASIHWCREQLGPERVAQLAGLAFSAGVEAPDSSLLFVVHANPVDLDRHIFPDMPSDTLAELVGGLPADILVVGHLHTPFVRRFRGMRIVNVAACGAPRDGDRRAVWGEFAWSAVAGWRWRIRRVAYDYGETVLHILDSRMPHPDRRIRDLLRATYV